MMITDALVYADETFVNDFAEIASYGFCRIVCISEEKFPEEIFGVKIFGAVIVKRSNGKNFFDTVKKIPKDRIVFVNADENSFNRTAITTKGVHLLTGISDLPKGGFDHITAKMASEKHVGVVIDLSKIVDGKTRRVALAKYADILQLHRKFGFPLVIGSGARDIFGVRNLTEISALCSLFGMTNEEVLTALTNLDEILSPPKAVTVLEDA